MVEWNYTYSGAQVDVKVSTPNRMVQKNEAMELSMISIAILTLQKREEELKKKFS